MSVSTSTTTRYTPFAVLEAELSANANPLRLIINTVVWRDERSAVRWLLEQLADSASPVQGAQPLARRLVTTVRAKRMHASGVDALMHEFTLSSDEGVALMCLAEALLRIPDSATADSLIADKVGKGDWRKHLGESPSLFVNAATWALIVTGKLVGHTSQGGLAQSLDKLLVKGGEPLVRKGVDLAMRMLGRQFVSGRTIDEALHNSMDSEARGYRHSYDMLGEAALTKEDARTYYAAYQTAIHAIGKTSQGRGIKDGPGISVKLSALHPRYSRAQRGSVMQELLPRLRSLMLLAKQYDIGINIDAEEAERLDLSLDLMEALAVDPGLAGFDGIGFVVQAYQKRSPFVLDYLLDLARRSGRKFMVRLVKGAYWDSEIKRAQVNGMPGYPVYTRKAYTDVSYMVCAQKLLAASDCIYPQFATHNALTLATIYSWAQESGVGDYEFQCLHGMGETLYDQFIDAENLAKRCRIYAPVGPHDTLLAYLVRRLLENGANSSFVNQVVDEKISIGTLLADPAKIAEQFNGEPHPRIPLPCDLFGSVRKNSAGMDLSDENLLREISEGLSRFGRCQWSAGALLYGASADGEARQIANPADRRDAVGQVIDADANDVEQALAAASHFAMDWQATAPSERADALMRAADLLESHRLELMAMMIREAGKTLPNALGEVREAVDFLRYYAAQVYASPNSLALGPVACISPWNFPLSIFIGQVGAALAAGNTVLAKPAEQTPLVAWRAVQLLHQAGIPRAALQFLPGPGERVGAALVGDSRIKGVIFTGSLEVAQGINRTLARRMIEEKCEIALIAETGGQNAMIVDSSALPEQVVQDVMTSAFDSAGQRCSALRVLCLQTDIADKVLAMLRNAMLEVSIGNPDRLSTDIGPVIDSAAQQALQKHIERMKASGRQVDCKILPPDCRFGTFVAPTLIEIAALSELESEVFGPVLHVLRYRRDSLAQLVDTINTSGYGLTLGIHSRIDETVDFITAHAHVGNIYVNRNMIGATVGVQPFGGEGKSGTGPKAGGPLYLKRLQRSGQADGMGATHHLKSPALESLLDWAGAHGHGRLIALGKQYLRDTSAGVSSSLPGPTGERNTYTLVPRGTALCIASEFDVLLNQLAALFATGNSTVVLGLPDSARQLDLPAAVLDRIQWVGNIDAITTSFQIALVQSSQANAWRRELADRNGTLIQVIDTTEDGPVPLWRLLAERAVCINTAASGGNASLMTLDL